MTTEDIIIDAVVKAQLSGEEYSFEDFEEIFNSLKEEGLEL